MDRIVKASDEKDKISVENTFRDFILKVGWQNTIETETEE